ncbi:MAG: hypothetical protein R3B98_03820 [Hyphomonas sp.]
MKHKLLLVLVSGLVLAAAADVDPSSAAPFAGAWSIALPDSPGVIVNKPLATCDAPAMISQVDEDTIHVATPHGDMGEWAVKSFEGRNPWWREDGASLVAFWVTDNAFLLADKDESGIKFDWANARKWSRCPGR